jgi:hypothetical protein
MKRIEVKLIPRTLGRKSERKRMRREVISL